MRRVAERQAANDGRVGDGRKQAKMAEIIKTEAEANAHPWVDALGIERKRGAAQDEGHGLGRAKAGDATHVFEWHSKA